MSWGLLVFSCVIAYLVGAIPFSWVFVRLLRGIDLRTVGSGNVGSTNAMRVLGVPWGLTIQVLDILKGWAPVFVLTCNRGQTAVPGMHDWMVAGRGAAVDLTHAGMLIGLGAILGHIFPIYLKFRGGKGVNTSIGVFFALAPKALLVAAVVGLTVLGAFRYVSLASMAGAATLPLTVWYFYRDQVALIIVTAVVALLVIVMHRSNIARLLAGCEPRLGRRVELADGQAAKRSRV